MEKSKILNQISNASSKLEREKSQLELEKRLHSDWEIESRREIESEIEALKNGNPSPPQA